MRIEEAEHPLVKELAGYELLGKYYNSFCPGCGYGIIANCVNRVLLDRGSLQQFPILTGEGCSCFMPFVLVGWPVYCLHGRAFPFLTGLKLANPSLKPILFTGDGDCLAIGLGHFLHAARRNVDAVVILLNNGVYGMTGGQMAPTTQEGNRTTTTPLGMREASFDAVQLAITAGATYVARWTIAEPFQLIKSLNKALDHKGFSLIEVISLCPTYYGRLNKMPTPVDMLRELNRKTIALKEAAQKGGELQGKVVVGEFLERNDKPELAEVYWKLISETALTE